jgi:hypothetical protein
MVSGLALGNNGPYIFEVTAPNGIDTKEYRVTVFRGDASKAITSFTITSPENVTGTVNKGTKTITVNVPYGTTVTAMTATASHTGASISPDPAAARDYSSPVSYTVTAADSSIQAYTVTVKAQSLTSTGSSTVDETALRGLISNAQNGDTLVISGDFDVSNTGSITITKNITIVSPPGETLTFHSECVGMAAFSVDSPGVLTIGGPGSGPIVLDGGAVWTGGNGTPAGGASNSSARITQNPLVIVTENGKFIMNDNVTLQNNDATDGSGSRAGALRIRGGEVIINGGIIKNCQANKSGDSAGAIHITYSSPLNVPSHLTINGGTIEGNKGHSAGSIFIESLITSTTTFEWTGGSIHDNSPNTGSDGSINITGAPTSNLHGNTAN